MDDRIEVNFEFERRAMIEGMVVAGRRRTSLARLVGLNAMAIALAAISAIGGIGVLFGVAAWSTGSAQDAAPWLFPVGAALGCGWLFVFQRLTITTAAGFVTSSRFGSGPQVMVMDGARAILLNDVAEWRTEWAGVEAVVPGRTTVTLAVSGIALPIPRTAFGDEAAQDKAIARMQAWHAAARA